MRKLTSSKNILFLKFLVLLFFIPFCSYSTHIVGGELNYKCLGGNQYQITLTVYRDCYNGVPPFDNPAAVGIFDNNNVLVTTVFLPFPGSTVLPPTVAQANVCVKTPTNICTEVAKYVGTVTLPPRAGGYQLAYQRCCRNSTISNIVNPGNTGATYYARIPDQSFACNSNPVFKNYPPIFICANNQLVFDHSATDADGDVIVYSLCGPLDGGTSGNSQPNPPSAPPYNPVTFKAPYSATNPLGGNTLTIDPNTGLMTGTPTTLGQFVVGVCADEYRGGVLISTTKRDFQFNVINCQPDIVSAAVHAITNCATHTVTFTNNSTGSNTFSWNFGDLTTLSDTSNVKNPTYTYPAVGSYTVSLIAYSAVNAKCNDTLKKYVVNVTGCPPCTMTLGVTKVDATCGTAGAGGGCTHIVYPATCTGTAQMNTYGNGGGISTGCSSGSGSGSVGAPSGTTPTSINIVLNGITLNSSNPPVPPATVTVTGATQATCPKTATYSFVGGVITFDYYLWLGATATLGSATVTSAGGTGPYTYAWTPTGGTGPTANNLSAGSYTVTVTDASGCQKTASTYINATSNMTVTVSQTALSACGASDGTGTATPSGGVGPYTYLWSNGQTTQTATGLPAGVYSVIVYDNGCSLSKTITILQPVTINANVSKTDAKCNGNNGTATSVPSGGSGPYTYSWGTSPVQTGATATGLIAGTYTVTVRDVGGCTGTASVTITDNSLALTSSSVDPICGGTNNGTASITATGGTLPYTYSWSSNPVQTTATATGLQGSTYIGIVTDGAGCSASVTITINQPSPLLPEPKNTSTINCAGITTGSAHVDVSGGTAAFTYLWSNGQTTQNITGLSSGTYTITVTDSKGCTGQNIVNVIPPPPLSLNYFPSNITGCNGDNTGSVTINPVGGNPGYTYSWNTTPVKTTQSITGLTAGTYTVVVTDNTGCTASLNNVVITQPTAITPSASSVPVGCVANNGTASITATGGTGSYTYLWAPTGKTTTTITGLSAGTYSVTVTDANGCSKTTSVNVTNASPPTVGISGVVNNVNCTGSATGSATVTATGGTGTLTYSWNNGVTSTTASAGGLTAGSYKVTVTDANGCTATQTINITQPASAVNATTSSTNATCGGSTGTASVTGSGGTPSYNFLWNNGQTTTTISGLSAGSYNVTVTDGNGCSKNASVSVNNSGGPTVGISGAVTNVGCTGSATGSATVTATGGTAPLTYSWNNGVTSTTGTVSGLTAGTYIVTVKDANNCAQGQTVIITQPASALGSTITGQGNVGCMGSATGSAAVTGTGGTPAYIYLWNTGQTSATITGLTSGTYSVTITDANSCTKQQTVVITEPASALGSTITSTNAACGGSNGSASVTATGGTSGYNYTWSPIGGTNAIANNLSAGTYTVSITDVNGCTRTETTSVGNSAGPTASIDSQSNVSCNGSATGSATVTASGGTPNYVYNWNNGQTTAGVTGLTAGTYTVIISDANGCSQQQLVTITQPATSVTVVSGSTNAACGSSNGTVSVTASGGTSGYTYNWSVGGQTNSIVTGLTPGTYTVVVTDANGCTKASTATVSGSPGPTAGILSSSNVTCNGLTNGSVTVTVSSGTAPYTYTWNPNVTTNNSTSALSAATYTVIVSDSAGCKDTTVITITQPFPLLFTISSNISVCAGESFTLTTTNPTGGTPPFTFNWLPSGPVISPLVPTTYSVTVTDASGCISQVDTIRVIPLPSPVAGFDTLSSGLFHEKYSFTDKSTGGNTWYWDFGDGTTSTLQNPYHTYPAGTYTVTQVVTNTTSGCTDTLRWVVVIVPNILIPNVFTPNHDGINDDFWIPNTGFESFTLEIYNRWGTKLFETDAGDIRWDGRTSAGVAVSDGTYYYILKAVLKDQNGGKNYDAHGFINLCRGGGK